MNLSTVDRVLSRIAATGNARDNSRAEVAAILATVSGAVERYLDRLALRTARTEYHDVEPWQERVSLRAFPVTTLTTIHYDPDQAFGSSTLLTSDDYYNPTLSDSGVVVFKSPFLPARTHQAALKVVYTGGMATDTDTFVSDYPDIAGAVDAQAAHEYQRRNAMGLQSATYADGSSATMIFDRWIPAVKQVLDHYRRLS